MVITLPLRLLRLPKRGRVALALGAFVVSVGLYELVGPSPFLSGVVLLPLILTVWLFGWQGGLLLLASSTLLLGASYSVGLGATLRPAAWVVPLLVGTGYQLVACLTIGGLRHLTKAWLGTQEALSQMTQAYQQERAQNEGKDQALQNLRHELRTPLTQIQGYLDLLFTFGEQCDATTQAQFIAAAGRGCHDLLNVVETSLAQDGATMKQACPHLNVFSLKHEIQDALVAFGPLFLRDHPLKLEIAESTQVGADPRLVRQVVGNLLTNINNYTPPSSEVTVSAAPIRAAQEPHGRAGMICVRVQDQGPGIAPLHLSAVFERGVRLPQARESPHPGMGLGLSICKHLVESMGGAMWVESTGRAGEGCCFCFTLAEAGAPETGASVKRKGGNHDRMQTLSPGQEQEPRATASGRGSR
jgi:signal transduction histidine kinase